MKITEVGPRDGLQNEAVPISTDAKLRFIAALAAAGVANIEATSFVSPKWVPQLSDAAELWPQLPPGPCYSALVPNARGLDRAIELGVKRIALFTAASDMFTQRNINQSVDESLSSFGELLRAYRVIDGNQGVRGYVSTAFECPYEGRISPERVVDVANRLWQLGCDEISFGDTIGVASPREVRLLAKCLGDSFIGNFEAITWHFHDTNGTAIANVSAALDLGYRSFDASSAGLGGCPYAPGAGGNLATEDLIYLLEREGFSTGIDLDALARASEEVLAVLGRPPTAKAQRAALAGSPRCSK